MSLKNYEVHHSEVKKGMFNFNQNFINSSDDDNNYEENNESNEYDNDITLQSMLNDIEVMNYDIKSKLNKIVNNSNKKNSINNANISPLINNSKKNKTSKKKDNNRNIKNLKNDFNKNQKQNKINKNKNKIITKKRNTDKKFTFESEKKNNILTKNTDKKINPQLPQIYVNRNMNNTKKNTNIPIKLSFAPLTHESNNKNFSLKKINTNYKKDFIYSSTQNIKNIKNKNSKNKKYRNASMTKRLISIQDKNCLTNIINKNYNTNTNENLPNKNLNKSLIISDEKKITLDLLIDEAKKRYNKNKINNVLVSEGENGENDFNKNKLQQFYEEHLNKKKSQNITNKRNIDNNNDFDNKLNYKNNNESLDIYKSYEYPKKL